MKNITTHKNTIIEFQEGLNLLYGPNGTGKSTVLKMIGFVLFNFLPGNQKNYVRKSNIEGEKEAKKYGMVKIWVVGLDDEPYVIQRSLGKAQPIVEITNANTGIVEEGINNTMDLLEWIKRQLSLSEEINLSDLFETSIGVPQGTFTEPFLRTPQKRKDFFNPVLQIDIYRDIWNKFKGINKELKVDFQSIKEKETKLTTRLEPKQELLNAKDNYSNELLLAKENLLKIKRELDEKTKDFSNLEEISSDFQNCVNKIEHNNSQKESLQSTIKFLNDRLIITKEADRICKETQSDFRRYEELKIEKEVLEQKQERYKAISDDLNNLKNQITKIESYEEEIRRQINEITKGTINLTDIEKNYEEFKKLQDLTQVQRDKIIRIEVVEEELETRKSNYARITTMIKGLEAQLKKLPEIEAKTTNTLEKIKSLKNMNKIQEEIENLKTHLKYLEELRTTQGELKVRKEQKIEISREIKKIIDKINLKSKEIEMLSNLQSQIENLENISDKYIILKNEVDKNLPKLKKKFDEFAKEKQPILVKISPLEKEIEVLEKEMSKLAEYRQELSSLEDTHQLYQINEKLGREYLEIEKNLQENQNKLKEVEKIIDKWVTKKKKLEGKFNKEEFETIRKEIADLREEKGKMENKITETNKLLNVTTEKLKILEKSESELKLVQDEVKILEFIIDFTNTIRSYFNIAGPKMTEALLININKEASNHYRDIMDDPNVKLTWDDEFLIHVEISKTNVKEVHQLSGGEQMAAALAVRLAILKVLSNAEFAFFDEPTTNLDSERRENLSKIIQRIKGFRQIFIISHDDSFEENVENVIEFTKKENEETKVEFIGKAEPLELIWDD